jgi:hypothetical protein
VGEIFKKYVPFIPILLGGCFYNPPIVTTTSEPQKIVKSNQKTFEPIRVEAKDWRSDPFESHKRTTVTFPETKLSPQQQAKLPLPDFHYGLTGSMFNGNVVAVLETRIGQKVLHNYVSPGALIPTNDKDIPYFMVDSITADDLILKSPDGRVINVTLSGLPPDALNDLKSKFN